MIQYACGEWCDRTPLHYACKSGKLHIAKVPLNLLAACCINIFHQLHYLHAIWVQSRNTTMELSTVLSPKWTSMKWCTKFGYNTWFLLDALKYAPIPTAITLTDSCVLILFHQIITIITDVDRLRPWSSSIIADHTTRNQWAIGKSSVCTSCRVHCTTLNEICFIAPCITQRPASCLIEPLYSLRI